MLKWGWVIAIKWNRNNEGYADITAGIAIQKVSRDEKEAAMAKRRSYRRTTDENAIHEKAVKIRKMTDEQLVHYVEDRVEKARSEGFRRGKAEGDGLSAADFVEEIGKLKGIGETTMGKIRNLLEKRMEWIRDA